MTLHTRQTFLKRHLGACGVVCSHLLMKLEVQWKLTHYNPLSSMSLATTPFMHLPSLCIMSDILCTDWANNSKCNVALVKALKIEQTNGYQAKTGWKLEAWLWASTNIKTTTGIFFTPKQCQTRFAAVQSLFSVQRTWAHSPLGQEDLERILCVAQSVGIWLGSN
jgi:hypothetical protein